ncbi:MAG: NAD(P)-dependent oxidoreductase [candidate division WOR-3 bacterium]|nr:MAG: NAD(P)-dependent oxidoreductase [candidate division WOR-3 bacterium]
MTNLVTSPYGLGESLIASLLEEGESVYTIFPSPKNVPMSYLGKPSLKYGFIRFDQDDRVEKALPRKVVNIFHIYDLFTGPFTRVFRANVTATLSLLDWARTIKVQQFIFISSGDVYGDGSDILEDAEFRPRSFYGTTKSQAETLLKYYAKFFDVKVVRVFFPFGKNYSDGYVFGIYDAVRRGESVDTEYHMISPSYACDLSGPLLQLARVKGHQKVNACGAPIAVEGFIEMLKSVSSGQPKTINTGSVRLTGSNEKAKELLNYRETPLKEALMQSFGDRT